MKQSLRRFTRVADRSVSMMVILAALSGCEAHNRSAGESHTIKLVSNYDEETDRSVMALQRKAESFLIKLEELDGSPECTYEHHKLFYAGAKVEISAIHVRAAALPDNQPTVEQVASLAQTLDSLEQLHKGKLKRGRSCFSKEEIAPVRRAFNAGFITIIKRELAKKRGGD